MKTTPYTLFKQLITFHHKLDPYAYKNIKDYKKKLDEKMEYSKMVKVYNDKELAGIAIYYVSKKMMVVTDVIVDEQYRKQGYGKELMDELHVQANKKKVKSMTLRVSPHNVDAILLYNYYGFKHVSLTMAKDI